MTTTHFLQLRMIRCWTWKHIPSHCLFMLYRWWKAVERWRVTVFINDLLVCNNIFTRPARLSPRSTSCLGWSWTTAGCPPKERQRTVNYNSNMETVACEILWVDVTQPEIAHQSHFNFLNFSRHRSERNGKKKKKKEQCFLGNHTGIKSFFFRRTTSPTSMFLHFDSWNLEADKAASQGWSL